MKEYSFNYDVHIFDTDCYGVAWHGSYTKWLEMGRVNLFKTIDLDMKELSDVHDIIFPVAEQSVRFKASARQGDVLRLTTRIKLEPPKLVFYQDIHNLHNDRHILQSHTDVVMVNGDGKLYRRFPAIIQEKLAHL